KIRARLADRIGEPTSLRRLLAPFFDVRNANPKQSRYITHRPPLIDEVVIFKRPLARLPCLVVYPVHIPEHLNWDPGRIGVVSCHIVSSSMAAGPPGQAAAFPPKRIREPGKFRHAVHLKGHME